MIKLVFDEMYVECDTVAEAVEFLKAMESDDIDGGWIAWNGGRRPVDKHSKVEYVMKVDSSDTHVDEAGALRWEHQGSDGDIIAYRVVE